MGVQANGNNARRNETDLSGGGLGQLRLGEEPGAPRRYVSAQMSFVLISQLKLLVLSFPKSSFDRDCVINAFIPRNGDRENEKSVF